MITPAQRGQIMNLAIIYANNVGASEAAEADGRDPCKADKRTLASERALEDYLAGLVEEDEEVMFR